MKIRAGSFLLEVASGAGLALVAYSLIARAPRGDAPRGTPVLSVAPSVVLKLFLSERGGSTLYTLAPDQRTVYYYAHLDRYAEGIVDGKQLRGGEVLGYVGDSGTRTPATITSISRSRPRRIRSDTGAVCR